MSSRAAINEESGGRAIPGPADGGKPDPEPGSDGEAGVVRLGAHAHEAIPIKSIGQYGLKFTGNSLGRPPRHATTPARISSPP